MNTGLYTVKRKMFRTIKDVESDNYFDIVDIGFDPMHYVEAVVCRHKTNPPWVPRFYCVDAVVPVEDGTIA